MEQIFGPRRSRATTKPRVQSQEPYFFACQACKRQYMELTERDSFDTPPTCCGTPVERLVPIPSEDLPESVHLDYKIVGGYNDNTVQVFWQTTDPQYTLKWVYLRTFTGGQLKHVAPKKRMPMVFALADEDAYAYCDQNPCLECIFCCKRGFVIYAMVEPLGLVALPLSRMSAYWQSKQ